MLISPSTLETFSISKQVAKDDWWFGDGSSSDICDVLERNILFPPASVWVSLGIKACRCERFSFQALDRLVSWMCGVHSGISPGLRVLWGSNNESDWMHNCSFDSLILWKVIVFVLAVMKEEVTQQSRFYWYTLEHILRCRKQIKSFTRSTESLSYKLQFCLQVTKCNINPEESKAVLPLGLTSSLTYHAGVSAAQQVNSLNPPAHYQVNKLTEQTHLWQSTTKVFGSDQHVCSPQSSASSSCDSRCHCLQEVAQSSGNLSSVCSFDPSIIPAMGNRFSVTQQGSDVQTWPFHLHIFLFVTSKTSLHGPFCRIIINRPQITPIRHQNPRHPPLYQQPTGPLTAVQRDKRSDTIWL